VKPARGGYDLWKSSERPSTRGLASVDPEDYLSAGAERRAILYVQTGG
jgi:hypothetical protein